MSRHRLTCGHRPTRSRAAQEAERESLLARVRAAEAELREEERASSEALMGTEAALRTAQEAQAEARRRRRAELVSGRLLA